MKLPATLRALRYRNFQLFFSGQLISLVGTWMQNVAQAWLVYRLTGSSVLLGAIGFASQIPIFLMSPLGGIVADRYSRHRVVIATQTISMLLAFALAGLTLTNTVQIWHIFVLAALLGVVSAFDIPARQSFMVEMVGRSDLMNGIALNSSMFNGTRVIGPAIAGMLVASIGEGWCFFVNAVSYIAVLVGLFLMNVPREQEGPPPGSPIAHMVEGFRFVTQNPSILAMLSLLGFVSLMGMPFTVLMPIFADRILHGGATTLGWLMGASGVGALAAALILASRQSLKGLSRWIAVSGICFGICLTVFAFSKVLWLSLVILAVMGFALMIQMGSTNTLIQSMVPDRLRGRVMSVYSMMLMGMAPIGALLVGAAADRWGAPLTVGFGGVVCAGAAGLFWTKLSHIRGHARQLIFQQQQQISLSEPPAPVEQAQE